MNLTTCAWPEPGIASRHGRRTLSWLGALLMVCLGGCARGPADPVTIRRTASPDGGEVTSVVEHDGAWVAVSPSGTFRSADQGRSWERMGPAPQDIPRHLTSFGSSLFLHGWRYVHRSDDEGRSWSLVGPDSASNSRRIREIAVAGGSLVGAIGSNVVRSSDHGVTWPDTVLRFDAGDQSYFDLIATDAGVYVVRRGSSAFRSRDGVTWQPAEGVWRAFPAGLDTSRVGVLNFVTSESDLYADFASEEGARGLLRSRDLGATWEQLRRPDIPAALFGAGPGSLWYRYNLTFHTCRAKPGATPCDSVKFPGDPAIREVRQIRGSMVASTSKGVYRSPDGGLSWAPSSRGIPAPIADAVRVQDAVVVLVGGRLFHQSSPRSEWTPLVIPGDAIKSLFSDSTRLFGTTSSGIARCEAQLKSCRQIPIEDVRNGPSAEWAVMPRTLRRLGSDLVVVAWDDEVESDEPNRTYLLRSTDSGLSWEMVGRMPQRDSPYQFAVGLDSILYAADRTSLAYSIDGGKEWKIAPWFRDEASRATSLAVAGSQLYVGTQGGTLAVLRWDGVALRFEKRAADGLNGAIAFLWADPSYPDVVLAATSDSVFSSDDGGRRFHPARFREDGEYDGLTGLFDLGDTRLLGSNAGLLLIEDNISRGGRLKRFVLALGAWHARHSGARWYAPVMTTATAAGAYLVGLLALLLTAWRRGSVALGRTRLRRVMRRVLLELPGVARWALFLGYAQRLRGARLVQQAGHDFFGLPAEGVDGVPIHPEEHGRTLIEAIATAVGPQRPLLVFGRGGAGKSTLMGRLAWLALHKELPEPLRKHRPVLVPASYYHGDLATAIADALREQYGVDVSGETLTPQLETGAFLILIDGASEIDSPEKESAFHELVRQAQSADFVRCRFVISSRPVFGPPQDVPVVRLHPLTPPMVSLLLPRYHLSVTREAKVRKQLAVFGSNPIAPLLFTLAVADGDGSANQATRTGLYERYFRRLLGVEGENSALQWAGWQMALGQIARWSFLETGLRGIGLRHEVVVTRLQERDAEHDGRSVPERLEEFFDVSLPARNAALSVLRRLSGAGILEGGPPQRWRFVHDTFEEYFAAASLVETLRATDRWPDVERWRTHPERRSEFREVVSFALEMEPHLFVGEREAYPAEWHALATDPPDPAELALPERRVDQGPLVPTSNAPVSDPVP